MRGISTRIQLGAVVLVALLLSGCTAGSPLLIGGALLLAVLLSGCGANASVDHDGGSAADAGRDAGTDGGAGPCATVTCPAHMSCVESTAGPWCLPDADEDGLPDDADLCPHVADPAQADADQDGVGDACDLCPEPNFLTPCGDACCADPDGDGVPGADPMMAMSSSGPDNCPFLPNADQADADSDGLGDACDACPTEPDLLSPCGPLCLDSDADGENDWGMCSGATNDDCSFTPSTHVGDTDGDGVGDVCDPDGVEPLGRLQQRRTLLERLERSGILETSTVELAWDARRAA